MTTKTYHGGVQKKRGVLVQNKRDFPKQMEGFLREKDLSDFDMMNNMFERDIFTPEDEEEETVFSRGIKLQNGLIDSNKALSFIHQHPPHYTEPTTHLHHQPLPFKNNNNELPTMYSQYNSFNSNNAPNQGFNPTSHSYYDSNRERVSCQS